MKGISTFDKYSQKPLVIIRFHVLFLVFCIQNDICNRTGELCHDGVKNQGEEEIDCGGPCDPCGK